MRPRVNLKSFPCPSNMHQIEECLRTGQRHRKWVRIDRYHLDLYFRVTTRYLDGKMVESIDIATVEVDKECQGKGYFTQFINEIELLAIKYNRYVYVETILRGFLFDSLVKRGYTLMTTDVRSLGRYFMAESLEAKQLHNESPDFLVSRD